MDHSLPRYAFDLETTGLRWDTARITTVALYSPDVSVVIEDRDEARLIRRFRDVLRDLPRGVVISWNGAVFDGPFLAKRSDVLGIGPWFRLAADVKIVPKYEPQPGFEPVGLHPIFPAVDGSHCHVDVAYRWRNWCDERDVHWSLKSTAKAVGLNPIEVDREHMDALSVPERMAYNLSDVVATYELSVGPERFGSDVPQPDRADR